MGPRALPLAPHIHRHHPRMQKPTSQTTYRGHRKTGATKPNRRKRKRGVQAPANPNIGSCPSSMGTEMRKGNPRENTHGKGNRISLAQSDKPETNRRQNNSN